MRYDYQLVLSTHRCQHHLLESRGDYTGVNNIVSGSIEAPTLLAGIGFRVPVKGTRTRERYHIPMVRTNYLEADALRKAMSQVNHDKSFFVKSHF